MRESTWHQALSQACSGNTQDPDPLTATAAGPHEAAIGGWVKPAAEAAAAVVLIEHALFGHSIRWLQTLMLICCTLWILLTWPRGIRAALRPGIRRPLP